MCIHCVEAKYFPCVCNFLTSHSTSVCESVRPVCLWGVGLRLNVLQV